MAASVTSKLLKLFKNKFGDLRIDSHMFFADRVGSQKIKHYQALVFSFHPYDIDKNLKRDLMGVAMRHGMLFAYGFPSPYHESAHGIYLMEERWPPDRKNILRVGDNAFDDYEWKQFVRFMRKNVSNDYDASNAPVPKILCGPCHMHEYIDQPLHGCTSVWMVCGNESNDSSGGPFIDFVCVDEDVDDWHKPPFSKIIRKVNKRIEDSSFRREATCYDIHRMQRISSQRHASVKKKVRQAYPTPVNGISVDHKSLEKMCKRLMDIVGDDSYELDNCC